MTNEKSLFQGVPVACLHAHCGDNVPVPHQKRMLQCSSHVPARSYERSYERRNCANGGDDHSLLARVAPNI